MDNYKKRPRPITRIGCQEALRVILSQKGDYWTSKDFLQIHNHETASTAELQFLRSHHGVSKGLLAQVRSMNKVSIKTSQILTRRIIVWWLCESTMPTQRYLQQSHNSKKKRNVRNRPRRIFGLS